ncbi:MFS transporter [Kangiella shandongensis]|uniref:MFS transporter n=1 Tax=Kangiella shandongensis TaxID=2763258 RepID=UPI001CC001AE|nr:MFS transporter [Kangiella shandongensis]
MAYIRKAGSSIILSWYSLPVIMGIFQSSLFAATPQFIALTGLATWQWSILLSLPTLFFLVLSPRWGRWADKSGASYVIRYSAVGLSLSIISFAIIWWLGVSYTFSPLVWFIAIGFSRILYGISASGVMPICQSLALDTSTVKEGSDDSLKRLGWVSAGLSVGRIVGPVLLLLFAVYMGWLFGIFCAAAIVSLVFISRFSVKHAPRRKQQPMTDKAEPTSLHPSITLMLCMAFAVTLYVGYLQFVLGPLFLDWMETSEEATKLMSLTMLVVAAVALLCQVFIVKRLAWRSPSILSVLALILTLASLSLGWVHQPLVILIAVIPMALSIALMTPVYSRLAMASSEASKGQTSGRLAVAHTAGYPAGSLLAGLFYSISPDYWWLPLCLIACFIGLVSARLQLMPQSQLQQS